MIVHLATLRRVVGNICLGSSCLMLLTGLSSAQVNHFSAGPEKVDVTSATQIQSTETQYAIHLAYSFEDHPDVWLEGIGTVTGRGELSYVLRGANVVFRQSKLGPVLASVAVDPTEYHQSPKTENPFPQPPPGGLNWQEDTPGLVFAIALPKTTLLISNTLQSGAVREKFLFTPCRPDDEGCLLSKWTDITSPAAAIQAQFAVMLTYTAVAGPKKSQTQVKLWYIARQGYLGGSEWSYVLSKPISDLSAQTLLDIKHALTTNIK